jgi:hypothetical protein
LHEKSEEKRPLATSRHRQEDSITNEFLKNMMKRVDLINLFQDRDPW